MDRQSVENIVSDSWTGRSYACTKLKGKYIQQRIDYCIVIILYCICTKVQQCPKKACRVTAHITTPHMLMMLIDKQCCIHHSHKHQFDTINPKYFPPNCKHDLTVTHCHSKPNQESEIFVLSRQVTVCNQTAYTHIKTLVNP